MSNFEPERWAEFEFEFMMHIAYRAKDETNNKHFEVCSRKYSMIW